MFDVERYHDEQNLSIGIEEAIGDNYKRKSSMIKRGDVPETIWNWWQQASKTSWFHLPIFINHTSKRSILHQRINARFRAAHAHGSHLKAIPLKLARNSYFGVFVENKRKKKIKSRRIYEVDDKNNNNNN